MEGKRMSLCPAAGRLAEARRRSDRCSVIKTVKSSSAGELFTFGGGDCGMLGHGGGEDEPVPRLVEALA